MSEQNCCCCSSGCCGEPVVKTVSTRLTAKDILGNWKVRWGIGRMNHTVEPGLYAVGEPDGTSPILVSANYKLTFDSLRKELSGLNCWLLILDTKGINVWCAAGKGTFGTNELITQLTKTRVSEKLLHRTLILPQLGASGINANEVKQKTGFSVIFGPVRAKDIKSFLASGNQATEDMRTVQFTIWDRLILTPIGDGSGRQKIYCAFWGTFPDQSVFSKPIWPSRLCGFIRRRIGWHFFDTRSASIHPRTCIFIEGGVIGGDLGSIHATICWI